MIKLPFLFFCFFTENNFFPMLQQFVSTLIRVGSGMRFQINQPTFMDMRDDNAATYAETLEEVTSQQNPMLILCVASNNRIDRYSAIKKKCCVDRPVPTQVVLAKSLAGKAVMSIATKVAIQMNCKIGGIPWTVSIPLQGLMVVGFDVCHDTNSKDKDIGKYSFTLLFILNKITCEMSETISISKINIQCIF